MEFGDLEGDFWLGNELLSQMTIKQLMVLMVELEALAEYSTFR